MKNIEISRQVFDRIRNEFLAEGVEGYVYKTSRSSAYKIFKTDDKNVLENKLSKIIKFNKLGIRFFTNPIATISCNHEFVGYKMNYDMDDLEWYRSYLPLDYRIEYLKIIKEKLLILESYGILYPDLKCDNFLINRRNWELKFCDIDNAQIDDLGVDVVQKVSQSLVNENNLFDNSIHAFMHNIYTLDQLEKLQIWDTSSLSLLGEGSVFASFNENQKQIFQDMVLVKKRDICGRYLIDNLR